MEPWPEKKTLVRIGFQITTFGAPRPPFEVPTREDGELSYQAVRAIFPGVTALKYSLDGATRVCSHIGDIFEAPEDGWGERVYTPNIVQQASAPDAATTLPRQTQILQQPSALISAPPPPTSTTQPGYNKGRILFVQ